MIRFLLFNVTASLVLVAEFTCASGRAPSQPPPSLSSEKTISSLASRYVDNGGFIVSNSHGQYKHNPKKLFTPASILKIATAATATNILGPEYHFSTSFFQDDSGNLYIQGHGDPFLTSEEIVSIWSTPAMQHLRPVTKLFLDDSAYKLESTSTDGSSGSTNPYDALNSALAVNFNTIPIRVKDHMVNSLEPQTPTLPIMTRHGKELPDGKYRIAISKKQNDILEYAGQLFIELGPETIISKATRVESRTVPKNLSPLYTHYSSNSLSDGISKLLLYSNNFIANQFFLACGAARYGQPATWLKGKTAMALFLEEQLHIKPSQFTIQEGSGLSRQNKLSPTAMLTVLEHFKPYAQLLPKHGSTYLKSGTLTGVYSYAGYLGHGEDLFPFVLMLNQKTNNRDLILDTFEKLPL